VEGKLRAFLLAVMVVVVSMGNMSSNCPGMHQALLTDPRLATSEALGYSMEFPWRSVWRSFGWKGGLYSKKQGLIADMHYTSFPQDDEAKPTEHKHIHTQVPLLAVCAVDHDCGASHS